SIQSRFLAPAIHKVHVLDRLPRGAFEQVVNAGDDNQPPSIVRQAESDIAVIRVQGKLNLRQLGRGKDAYPGRVRIKLLKTTLNFGRSCGAREMHVNGR